MDGKAPTVAALPEPSGVTSRTYLVHRSSEDDPERGSDARGEANADLVTDAENRNLKRGLHERHLSMLGIAGAIVGTKGAKALLDRTGRRTGLLAGSALLPLRLPWFLPRGRTLPSRRPLCSARSSDSLRLSLELLLVFLFFQTVHCSQLLSSLQVFKVRQVYFPHL